MLRSNHNQDDASVTAFSKPLVEHISLSVPPTLGTLGKIECQIWEGRKSSKVMRTSLLIDLL